MVKLYFWLSFKHLKAVICVRYYALVFAYVGNVPTLCVAYDTKILEYVKLMERLGKKMRGLILKPEDLSPKIITSFLKKYVDSTPI